MVKRIKDASTLNGWRKSSYSGAQNGSCVEVVDGHASGVPVRDSKIPTGPALLIPPTSWTSFLDATKRGRI